MALRDILICAMMVNSRLVRNDWLVALLFICLMIFCISLHGPFKVTHTLIQTYDVSVDDRLLVSLHRILWWIKNLYPFRPHQKCGLLEWPARQSLHEQTENSWLLKCNLMLKWRINIFQIDDKWFAEREEIYRVV